MPQETVNPNLRQNKNIHHLPNLHIYTEHKVPNIRIKNEIKYLRTKKQQMNQQIYQLHLSLANPWKNISI
jgi:hypothetical protein